MRGGILAAGILLLILGIFLYFNGNNMMREVEAYDVEDIPISEILKLVSEDAREHYETGQQMVMFGSIFGIVGLVICIGGIAAPSKKELESKPHNTQSPPITIHQTTSSDKESKHYRRCPECGRVIPDDAKMCPYCGKKFKAFFDEGEPETQSKKIEPAQAESPQKIEEKIQKCSKCGYKFEEEDLDFCPKCGERIKTNFKELKEETIDDKLDTKSKEIKYSKFCKKCGAPIKEKYRFCKICGNKLINKKD